MNGEAELRRLEAIAAGAGAPELAAELQTLAARTAQGQFYMACVGQTKRGKSTLLNALVGDPVLPTGILPVTTVPTVLRHGEPAVRVRMSRNQWQTNAREELVEYVAEERNPGNRKGVVSVEVFLPCPFLASGLCLVDTPGLGSVFEANTAATRAFVPQIDAAIVVLGADPPITGEELDLVQAVAREVDQLVFVLNKSDRIRAAERREVAEFTERVLRERLGREVAPILEVSALAAGRHQGDPGNWLELVATLSALAAGSGSLVSAAIQRGVRRLGAKVHWLLGEHRGALLRPVSESEERVRALDSLAEASERARSELGPLFAAEQQRMSRALSARHQQFLQRALPIGLEQLQSRLQAWRGTGARLSRAKARDLANEVARDLVTPWLEAERLKAEMQYREVSERFGRLAMGFLQRLAESGGPNVPAVGIELDQSAYSHRSYFYFHHLLHRHAPPMPWASLLDAILPNTLVERRVARVAEAYLRDLLETNASRVQGDVEERVTEARRQHEAQIGRLLAEVRNVAARALERARAAQAKGDQTVRSEVSRLDELRAEVQRLIEAAENIGQSSPDSPSRRSAS
jgi:GTP-binding protein EngB required for normal cell division